MSQCKAAHFDALSHRITLRAAAVMNIITECNNPLLPSELNAEQIQRIINGVGLLDSSLGFNWAMMVDLKTFDINSFSHCILAQTCGTYNSGLHRLNLNDIAASEYGFYPHRDDHPSYMNTYSSEASIYADKLAELKTLYWKELIAERQKTALIQNDSQHSEKLS